jgi:hypothetical protein
MKLSTLALTVTATLSIAAAFTGPALALDGRHAVGACIDRGPTHCSWTRDAAGGIDIMVDGHWISCPSAEGECTVVDKTATGKKVIVPGNVTTLLH